MGNIFKLLFSYKPPSKINHSIKFTIYLQYSVFRNPLPPSTEGGTISRLYGVCYLIITPAHSLHLIGSFELLFPNPPRRTCLGNYTFNNDLLSQLKMSRRDVSAEIFLKISVKLTFINSHKWLFLHL